MNISHSTLGQCAVKTNSMGSPSITIIRDILPSTITNYWFRPDRNDQTNIRSFIVRQNQLQMKNLLFEISTWNTTFRNTHTHLKTISIGSFWPKTATISPGPSRGIPSHFSWTILAFILIRFMCVFICLILVLMRYAVSYELYALPQVFEVPPKTQTRLFEQNIL